MPTSIMRWNRGMFNGSYGVNLVMLLISETYYVYNTVH